MKSPFKTEVAKRFSEAITRLGLSKTRAADDLGVSREMLYRYLRGEAEPRHQVLARACRRWKIDITYKNVNFGELSFGPAQTPPRHSGRARQMVLFEAIGCLRNDDLDVKVLKKRGNSVELKLKIKFAS